MCYIAAAVIEPGRVQHSGELQKIVIGEYGGAQSLRVSNFYNACIDSGIDIEISAEIEQMIWEKFVVFTGVSGTTSTMRSSIGPIRDHPRTRAFLHDTMHEVVQIARAQGVPLAPDHAEAALAFVDQLPAEMTSSMHHDLRRGNRLEVAWLSGDVSERGASLGIATPCNRAIRDILTPHSDGHMSDLGMPAEAE